MPYIKQSERKPLIAGGVPLNSGELNFCITKMVNNYLKRTGESYDHINTVIGVLECAKLELYRRIAAPYEDEKCEEHGDVYT
jgi:hypothetical protein